MAILIPHLFLQRLSETTAYDQIKILVIGSFNPGMPVISALSDREREEYDILKAQGKLDRQKRLLNFYNRTNNRFWGILDRLYYPRLTEVSSQKPKKTPGLKYYSSIEPEELTYQRQKEFCFEHKIFITDIVRSLNCDSLEGIYSYFTDAILDKYAYEWNTEKILEIINLYKPQRVLFTFKPSKSIPNISKQVEIIKNKCESVHFLLSPSGNALNSYDELVQAWRGHFIL